MRDWKTRIRAALPFEDVDDDVIEELAQHGAAIGLVILLLVSVCASIVPARRAARVDPITVLRA